MYAAGIVLFNPNIDRLKENIERIYNQVGKVILVDNCSANKDQVKKILEKFSNTMLIENKENEGIAKALNQIFIQARKENAKWVITLDQDSLCPLDIINRLSLYVGDDVGIVCPRFIDRSNTTRIKKQSDSDIDIVKECITSGSLTSVYAWEIVGGFNEWMFIDGVDYDFCLKVYKNNLKTIRVNSMILDHQVGNLKIKRFLWFKVKTYNHSSFRNYYFVRNSIYIIKKHGKVVNRFKRILYLLYWETIKIVFERNRIKTIKSAFKGFIDGVKS